MQEIGFSLYNDMLNQAVRALKRGETPDLDQPFDVTTEVNLHVPALLPQGYCVDVHERLSLYKRLSHCEDGDALDEVQAELIDRFGMLPDPGAALLESHRLRLLAKPLGIVRVDASSESIVLQFVPRPPIDPVRLMQLIQRKSHYKLAGPDRLRIQISTPGWRERAARTRELFKELG